MRVLGIETSCDETGVALYDSKQGLMAHSLYSQVSLHQAYGGVVPELASRDHSHRVLPLITETLHQADTVLGDIDGIAYTAGPGLMGALLVGAVTARSLGFALQKPCIGIHHLEAHLLAVMLEVPAPSFPFVALIVSGGHTLLVRVNAFADYQVLGETLDDAVGEAFDKTAKLMGLAYPGGPILAALAEQGRPGGYRFPRPMVDRPGLDFSFSGLKTYALNTWHSSDQTEQTRADLAKAFQDAVVDTLMIKCRRALEQTGFKRLVVAGGVGANQALRSALTELLTDHQGDVFFPRMAFCTDNGAMVAYAGWCRLRAGFKDTDEASIRARWPLDSVSA